MKSELEDTFNVDSKDMVRQTRKHRNRTWGSRPQNASGQKNSKGGKGVMGKIESLLDSEDMDKELNRDKDTPTRTWIWVFALLCFGGLGYYLVKVFKKYHGAGGAGVVRGEPVNYDNISFE